MEIRFTGIGISDTGVVRTANQDNYFIDDDGRFFIVADGMGGHAGGEQASKIATEEIKAYLNEHWDSSEPAEVLLKEAIHRANKGILKDQESHPERGDMGTTLVLVVFKDEKPWVAHIGDSRLYRLRGTQLEQITEDHTWVARALQAGEITKEEAKVHPWRHVLSQCLGRRDIHKIDIEALDFQRGDRLLLCSDGLTEEVPDELITASIEESLNSEQAVTKLVEEAKKAGGSDNVTVIIVAEASENVEGLTDTSESVGASN